MVVRPLLRIAVLECDEPAGKTKERYGNYGGLFQKLLENGVKKVAEEDHGKRPALEVSRYDVVKDMDTYPTLEDVDAVLLTGSSESHNLHFCLQTLQRLIAEKVPVMSRIRLLRRCALDPEAGKIHTRSACTR